MKLVTGNMAFIHTTGTPVLNSLSTKIEPTVPSEKKSERHDEESKHIKWGENDSFPVDLDNDARKDTIIKPAINFKSEMQYGGGIVVGEIITDGKNEYFEIVRPEETIEFFRENMIDNYCFKSLYDLNEYASAYAHLIWDVGKKKIARLTIEYTRTKWCRLSPLNDDGDFETLFINPDFGTDSFDEKNTKEIPCAPRYGISEWAEENKEKITEFIIPLQMADGGNMYYPEPDWNTVRKSGWYEIGQAISDYKKYLMQNQMSIKYHIEVHPDFWPLSAGKEQWDKYEQDEKLEFMEAWLLEFSDFMKDVKNTASAWLTTQKRKENTHLDEVESMITINELKSDFGKDMYTADSQESAIHKHSAMNMHSEMTGGVPNDSGGIGAGSGSGSRVAFNQRVALSKYVQDLILHPFYVVSKINKWDQKYSFRMRNSLITTLDSGSEATKPDANTGTA